MSTQEIEISSPNQKSKVVFIASGGRIISYQHQNRSIFKPTTPIDVDGGCFALVPYSNRIVEGNFIFDGTSYELKKDLFSKDRVHSLHGYGWLLPWECQVEKNHAILKLEYVPQSKKDFWPWHCLATQTIVLEDDQLELALTIKNCDISRMPVGGGFHPYFATFPKSHRSNLPLKDGIRFKASFKSYQEIEPFTQANQLVLYQNQPIPRKYDFSHGQLVPVGLDHCFCYGSKVLEVKSQFYQLTITTNEILKHVVIYSPSHGDFVCIEPVANRNNAFKQDLDVISLDPQQSIEMKMTIQIQ